MADITVARRYAQALYEEADTSGQTAAVDEDVDVIRASLEGSRELVLFFESPIIAREKKEAVVKELFGDRLRPLTVQFLDLLIEKGREDLFPDVVHAYRELRDRQLGVVEARARTAHPLGEAERARLVEAVERMTGRRVRLKVTHDPSLIGGVVIRVGDTVYDGSVRHKLASLREQLVHGVSANAA